MTNVLVVNRSAFCTKSMPLKGDTDTEFVRSSAYPQPATSDRFSYSFFWHLCRRSTGRSYSVFTNEHGTAAGAGCKMSPSGEWPQKITLRANYDRSCGFREPGVRKQCGFSLGHLAVRPWTEEGRRAGQTAQPPHVCRRESYHHAGARPTSLTRPHAPGCGHSDTDGRR